MAYSIRDRYSLILGGALSASLAAHTVLAQQFPPPANPYPTTATPASFDGGPSAAPPPAQPIAVAPPGGYPTSAPPPYSPPTYPSAAPPAAAPFVPPIQLPPGEPVPYYGPPANPAQSNLAPFEDGQIIARVGDSVILAGDITGSINQVLEPYRGKAPEEELKRQAQPLMKQFTERQVETKLAYLDFMRSVPADKKGELELKLNEQFEESHLPTLLKQYKVESAPELDAKLRQYGTSLVKVRRQFGERLLGQQMIRKNMNINEEITFEQMLDYYKKNEAEFAFTGQVKWEHLMMRFDKFPDRGQAYRALAQMGNEVLRGAPLAAVARRSSQAPDADSGGQHEWTTQGSLASTPIDQALFSLPPTQLSAVIEDDTGFHIVRVLERREAGKAPFEEAQVTIKEKIKKDRMKDQTDKYLAKLRAETRVWTIYDNEATAAGAGP